MCLEGSESGLQRVLWMQVIKVPIDAGDWVVEAETGQVGQKRRGVSLPGHITQAEPGDPSGSWGRGDLEHPEAPSGSGLEPSEKKELSPKPAASCPTGDSGLQAGPEL